MVLRGCEALAWADCAPPLPARSGSMGRAASLGVLHIIHCRLRGRAGEAVAGSLSLRIQQLDVRCETKTLDNVRSPGRACFCFIATQVAGQDSHHSAPGQVFVNVVVSVQYQVGGRSRVPGLGDAGIGASTCVTSCLYLSQNLPTEVSVLSCR